MDFGFELTAYSEANHTGCHDDCKSTSGGVQFLEDKLVSWSSKKQDCTVMSTAEAEYVSVSACCAQVMWMRTQLMDHGFRFNKIPMYCDSKSAIAISSNPIQHSRTKHINIWYHFLKEHVEKGTVELYFVGTEYQLADLFTKALSKESQSTWIFFKSLLLLQFGMLLTDVYVYFQDRIKEMLNDVPQSNQTDSFKEQVFIYLVGPNGHGSVKTFGGGVSDLVAEQDVQIKAKVAAHVSNYEKAQMEWFKKQELRLGRELPPPSGHQIISYS
ncbi:hypothetical protein Tco_1570780 [Tanacetum coccineum]